MGDPMRRPGVLPVAVDVANAAGAGLLASGRKRRSGKTPIVHRDPIGVKGIGKLAGLGIARRIGVESWPAGIISTFAISRDEMERA